MASLNIDAGTAQKIANRISGRNIEAAVDAYIAMSRRVTRMSKTQSDDPYVIETSKRIKGMRDILMLFGVTDMYLEVVD